MVLAHEHNITDKPKHNCDDLCCSRSDTYSVLEVCPPGVVHASVTRLCITHMKLCTRSSSSCCKLGETWESACLISMHTHYLEIHNATNLLPVIQQGTIWWTFKVSPNHTCSPCHYTVHDPPHLQVWTHRASSTSSPHALFHSQFHVCFSHQSSPKYPTWGGATKLQPLSEVSSELYSLLKIYTSTSR